MNKIWVYICVLFCLVSFAGEKAAWAELGHRDVPLFKPQRLGFNLEFQSFKSRANYASTGLLHDLFEGNEFLTFDLLLNITYDFSDVWAFTAGVELAYGESFDQNYRRSTRRVRGINLGVYRLLQITPSLFLIPDAHYFLNTTKNSVADDDVSIGDGAPWGQVGVWFVHEFPSVFLYKLYAGFRSRGEGYSNLLVYRIGPEVKLERFGLGVSFTGFKTITNDTSSENALSERQQVITLYNAGSLRYNSENPYTEEVSVWLSYEFETLSFVKLGVHQVLGIENTADGFGFLLELQTSFRVDDGGLSFPYFTKTTRRAKERGNRAVLKNLGPDPREKGGQPVAPVVVPASEF